MYSTREKKPGLTFLPPPASVNAAEWVGPVQYLMPIEGFVSPYSPAQSLKLTLASQQLMEGWESNDVGLANTALASFVSIVGSIQPGDYPSSAKRTTELWYNRSFNGTIVAAVYFVAMTLFLMVAVGVTKRVEKGALIAFGIAVALACDGDGGVVVAGGADTDQE